MQERGLILHAIQACNVNEPDCCAGRSTLRRTNRPAIEAYPQGNPFRVHLHLCSRGDDGTTARAHRVDTTQDARLDHPPVQPALAAITDLAQRNELATG